MRVINPNNPNRLKVLVLTREEPGLSLTEIATRTGLSRTAVRHHLVNLDREGVIRRVTERRNRGRYTKPNVRKHRKISSEKMTEYARQGRGANAFVPRKTKKRDILQRRIEMVVRKALQRQGKTDYDVIRHANAPLRFTNAHKIG